MNGSTLAVGLLLVAVSGIVASAAVVVVPSDCCEMIQDGIDAASNGDTVLVLAGIYQGAGNVNLDFQGKSVTIRGEGPDATIIDCERLTRLVYLDEGPLVRLRLENLTIANGFAGPTGFGGGIHLDDNNIEMNGVRVLSCEAVRGGGLYSAGGIVLIQDCEFYGNAAERGGGMYLAGGFSSISNSRVTGNQTNVPAGWGAGVYGAVGTVDVKNTVIAGNYVMPNGNGGAGLALSGCTATLEGVTVAGNWARTHGGGGGGGLRLGGGFTTIERCAFYDNCASFAGQDILSSGSSHEIRCTYVTDVVGEMEYEQAPITGDVASCFPVSCLDAPVFDGIYTVSDESVLRPENNECGVLLGAVAEDCGVASVDDSETSMRLGLIAVPTPAKDEVQLFLPFVVGQDPHISVYDAVGKSVDAPTSIEGAGAITVSVRGMAAGTYFIRVVDGARVAKGRMVILPR